MCIPGPFRVGVLRDEGFNYNPVGNGQFVSYDRTTRKIVLLRSLSKKESGDERN